MSLSDYSELTDLTSDEEDYLPSKSTRKKTTTPKKTDYKIDQTLRPPRTTQYTAKYLYDQIIDSAIDLDPEYQRDVVWPESKQSGLIDSMLRNYYIPPVIFAVSYNEDGSELRTCIDGKQRLTSMQRFFDGQISHRDTQKGGKFWYKDASGVTRRRLLPPAYRSQFANKQIVCVEYESLTGDQEREIFQRVQLGMALTPAERMQAFVGVLPSLIREVQTQILGESGFQGCLDWGTSRGRDFQCLASILYMIQHLPKKTFPGSAQLEKWLSETEALSEKLRTDFIEIFNVFVYLARDKHYNASLNKPSRVSPIEFIMIGVLIHKYRTRLTMTQLSSAVQKMRSHVRVNYTDIRSNTKVTRTLLEFINKVDMGSLKADAKDRLSATEKAASMATVKSLPKPPPFKRKRAQSADEGSEGEDLGDDNDDDDDMDVEPEPKPRKRGRPPKAATSTKAAAAKMTKAKTPKAKAVTKTAASSAKKSTGTGKKSSPEEAPTSVRTSPVSQAEYPSPQAAAAAPLPKPKRRTNTALSGDTSQGSPIVPTTVPGTLAIPRGDTKPALSPPPPIATLPVPDNVEMSDGTAGATSSATSAAPDLKVNASEKASPVVKEEPSGPLPLPAPASMTDKLGPIRAARAALLRSNGSASASTSQVGSPVLANGDKVPRASSKASSGTPPTIPRSLPHLNTSGAGNRTPSIASPLTASSHNGAFTKEAASFQTQSTSQSPHLNNVTAPSHGKSVAGQDITPASLQELLKNAGISLQQAHSFNQGAAQLAGVSSSVSMGSPTTTAPVNGQNGHIPYANSGYRPQNQWSQSPPPIQNGMPNVSTPISSVFGANGLSPEAWQSVQSAMNSLNQQGVASTPSAAAHLYSQLPPPPASAPASIPIPYAVSSSAASSGNFNHSHHPMHRAPSASQMPMAPPPPTAPATYHNRDHERGRDEYDPTRRNSDFVVPYRDNDRRARDVSPISPRGGGARRASDYDRRDRDYPSRPLYDAGPGPGPGPGLGPGPGGRKPYNEPPGRRESGGSVRGDRSFDWDRDRDGRRDRERDLDRDRDGDRSRDRFLGWQNRDRGFDRRK